MRNLSFDDLPRAVSQIGEQLDAIQKNAGSTYRATTIIKSSSIIIYQGDCYSPAINRAYYL